MAFKEIVLGEPRAVHSDESPRGTPYDLRHNKSEDLPAILPRDEANDVYRAHVNEKGLTRIQNHERHALNQDTSKTTQEQITTLANP